MKTIPAISFLLIAGTLVAAAFTLRAQSVSYTGGTLTQNFDGMGATGNTTPTGWYVGFGTSANTTAITPAMGLQPPNSSILGWNLGSTNGVGTNPNTDRALGTGPTGSGNDGLIEIRIANNTGHALVAFEVRYDGEQWRTPQGGSPVDQLILQFSTNGTSFSALGAAFDFIRPVTTPATSALDGNLAANRTANLGGLFAPPAPLPAGATFHLRWFDVNDAGITDSLLAIDDFSFREIPASPVAITTQPQNSVKTAGEAVAFSVGATGLPVYYQWLSNGVPISGATDSSYAITVTSTNMSGSSYSVIASNSLNSIISSAATLTVFPDLAWKLVSLTNHTWRYDQSGADLGSGWKEPGYNDTGWPEGRGVLALESSATVTSLTNTVLSLTNGAGERVLTYYFRTTFTVSNPEEIAFLTFSNLIDDGCVVWLNGAEAYRINLTNGPITATNLALAAATEGEFIVTNLPASSLLVPGTNVLAVEVHQINTTSSDVVMGLAMNANPWNGGPLVIVQPPQNQTVNPGGRTTFAVQASGYAPLSFQWRFNGVDIPGATSANLALTNISLVRDGFYWAVVSNGYGAVVSSPARLRVVASGLLPYYQTDFAGGAGSEWSNTKTEITPLDPQRFLGQFANQTVSLRLTNLPPHSNIVVSLDLFIVQTWNGNGTAEPEPGPDFWRLGVAGDSMVLNTTFKGYSTGNSPYDSTQAFPDQYPYGKFPGMTGADETNTLGYMWGSGIMDTVYRQLTYSIAHSGGSVQLDFSGSGLQGIGDEAWGLDNVKVYLNSGTVAGWPMVLTHPTGQNALPGATASFSVAAIGAAPLAYQWRFNGVEIAGANASTLTLPSITLANDGFYSVRVSNADSSVLSEPARLSVDATPLVPFYANDFERAVGAEWSSRQTEATPLAERKFLGQFTNQLVSLSFPNLPPHTNLTIAFDLFVIRSWDGNGEYCCGPDIWDLSVAGLTNLVHATFAYVRAAGDPWDSQTFPDSYPGGLHGPGTGASETNTLGYFVDANNHAAGVHLHDSVYRLVYSLPHGLSSATFLFSALGAGIQTLTNESWGLDNVQVYLDGGSVPGWPLLSGQLHNESIAAGSNFMLNIHAAGAEPMHYQWFRDGMPLADDEHISGASSSKLSLATISPSDLGAYTLVISNAYGVATSTSAGLTLPPPNWNWAIQCGGPENDNFSSVTMSSQGDVLVASRLMDTSIYAPSNITSRGERDVAIVNYTSRGELQWLKHFGGTDDDRTTHVVADAAGNIYVTGAFMGTLRIEDEALISAGHFDVFVAKLDATGNLLWAKRFGSTGSDFSYCLDVDSEGNCYVAGFFHDTVQFDTHTLVSAGGEDIFLAKLNNSGLVLWAVRAGGTGNDDEATDVEVNQQGDCLLAGRFTGTASFGGIDLISVGSADVFLARFDRSGALQWIVSDGGIGYDTASDLCFDEAGDCYLTGYMNATAEFTGNGDFFISAYDSSSGRKWIRQAGGPTFDRGTEITADRSGNLFVTGHYSELADFGTASVSPLGETNIFVAKYGREGALHWVQRAGGGQYATGWGIAVDSAGDCYACGWFSESCNFGDTVLTSRGGYDGFVAKLGTPLELISGLIGTMPNFSLVGNLGIPVRIEFADNLSMTNAWSSLTNLTLTTSPVQFSDPAAINSPMRFYRAVAP